MSQTRRLGRPYHCRPSTTEDPALKRPATSATLALVLLALATLLAGCHRTRVVWAKPAGDAAALQSDMQACGYGAPTATADQPAPAQPSYQPTPALFGNQTNPPLSSYPSNPMAPTYSSTPTQSVTIDAPDSQRSPVSCMIAHGWRLTPLP